jgi:hypothetical protein
MYTVEQDGVRASWVVRPDGSATGMQFNGGVSGRDFEQAELAAGPADQGAGQSLGDLDDQRPLGDPLWSTATSGCDHVTGDDERTCHTE